MKINKYEDISLIDREAKKDYIDRHSAFLFAAAYCTKHGLWHSDEKLIEVK